jgi:ribosomal protein L29
LQSPFLTPFLSEFSLLQFLLLRACISAGRAPFSAHLRREIRREIARILTVLRERGITR